MTPGWANRTPMLIGLILVMQLAFVWSYVGALHEPDPKHVPLGVVAPEAVFTSLQEQVSAKTDAVALVSVADADTARSQVEDGTLTGAVVVGGTAANIDLLIVTGVPSIAYEDLHREVLDTLDAAITTADAANARGYSVEVVNPFEPGDPKGLTPFYLAVGWVVGGYLLLAFFGFTQRHPEGWAGLLRRFGVLAIYAVASGVGGAVIVGPVLHAFDGHLWALAAFGVGLSLAVTFTVQAVELLAGPIYGTGIAIIAFVVLGNPSAGGPFPRSFSGALWEHIGAWLPPGMGTDGIRAIVYDTPGLGAVMARIAGYVVLGALGCVAVMAYRVSRAGGAGHRLVNGSMSDPLARRHDQRVRPSRAPARPRP
jgi:hypothetical protein